MLTDLLDHVGGRYTHETRNSKASSPDANGLNYKLAQAFGDPNCASLNPISNLPDRQRLPQCRPAAALLRGGRAAQDVQNFSPKVGMQLHPTEDVMVYGAGRGLQDRRLDHAPVQPAALCAGLRAGKGHDLGSGVKSELLDRHLQINGAAFLTDYKGIQLNFQQGVRRPSRTPAMRGSRALK
jgi:iron complex outermembrane receptor protein